MTDVFDGCLFIGSTSLLNVRFLSEKENFSKRSMYGRAKFDLLRIRVLSSAQKDLQTQEKKMRNVQELRAGGDYTPNSQITTFRVSEAS